MPYIRIKKNYFLEKKISEIIHAYRESKQICCDLKIGHKWEYALQEYETKPPEGLSGLLKSQISDGNVNFEETCQLIDPFRKVSGRFFMTDSKFGFHEVMQIPNDRKEELYIRTVNLFDVEEIIPRRYLLEDLALEIFQGNYRSMFCVFEDKNTREKIAKKLCKKSGVEYQSVSVRDRRVHSLIKKWQGGDISNFKFLLRLNLMAGRSFNDISQYPVFPWILVDYESKTLDLNDPKNYRDLKRPIGALTEGRSSHYLERFKEPLYSPDLEVLPSFHYGTHYSTLAIILYYLIRVEPFTSFSISFHDGKMEMPDRVFRSLETCWDLSLNHSTDVKELIPEFFCLPEMFKNSNRIDFGACQDGHDEVVLPPWASSAEEFVSLNRRALESKHVSKHLNHWIDLIFGYKQKGKEAVKAQNTFYHLTYPGSVDISSVHEPEKRKALETQILNFGITPDQLLNSPCPSKKANRFFTPSLSELHEKYKVSLSKKKEAFFVDKHVGCAGREYSHCFTFADGVLAINKSDEDALAVGGFKDAKIRIFSRSHPFKLLWASGDHRSPVEHLCTGYAEPRNGNSSWKKRLLVFASADLDGCIRVWKHRAKRSCSKTKRAKFADIVSRRVQGRFRGRALDICLRDDLGVLVALYEGGFFAVASLSALKFVSETRVFGASLHDEKRVWSLGAATGGVGNARGDPRRGGTLQKGEGGAKSRGSLIAAVEKAMGEKKATLDSRDLWLFQGDGQKADKGLKQFYRKLEVFMKKKSSKKRLQKCNFKNLFTSTRDFEDGAKKIICGKRAEVIVYSVQKEVPRLTRLTLNGARTHDKRLLFYVLVMKPMPLSSLFAISDLSFSENEEFVVATLSNGGVARFDCLKAWKKKFSQRTSSGLSINNLFPRWQKKN